jgi:protein-S-isoprenylcysteine O-methyltransferase Ste14
MSIRWLLQAPRVLFALALAVLLFGLARHWGQPFPTTVIGFYLGWLLFEVPVTFRSAVPLKDFHTLVPYALARIATIAACVLLPPMWTEQTALKTVAALVFAGGVVLREVAIRTLGRFYSHHVAMRTDQVAVTTGPYRLMRHPAYAGMLLAHVGFVAFFGNPLALVPLALLFAAVIWRIRVEEKVLWAMPGYPSYATGRPRLLPGVW